MKRGNRFIDRTGQRYGSMVVVKHVGRGSSGDALWECVCDCGKTVIKIGSNLPKVKSCGNTCTAAWNTELPLIREDGEPFGIVYKLTNKKTGNVYIGQTVFSLEHRWKRHIEYANRGGEGYLQKAIRIYEPESFVKETIATAYDKRQLDELEKHYILQFDSLNPEKGYNQTWRPSPDGEARQTISEKNSGENNPRYREDLIDDELVDLYKSGWSLTKIAKQYGTDHRTLSLRFKKLGVEIKLQPNQKDLPIDEIVKEYQEGSSVSALARKYEVSNWAIHSRLTKSGIEIKKQEPPTTRHNVATEKLLKQYQAGIKISDLARIHKMDRKTIRARLKQTGQYNFNKFTEGWSAAAETVSQGPAVVG